MSALETRLPVNPKERIMPRVIALALLLVAVPTVAAEMKVQRDLAYAEPKNEHQTLDVYAPQEGENHPIVFWIHGGGWQAGGKEDVKAKPQFFVDHGFVFVSTNYRLLPEATIKQMGEDVAKAIRWVHDHAREFGGDPNRMFVMGHSAGAQLAALVCTDNRYLKSEGLTLASIIKGCVPVDGDTYDVPMQIATVEERIANIYRRKFGDEASQRDLSPVAHVAQGRYIPPLLILHVAEHPETKGQSNRLVSVLQEAGFEASAYPAAGKDHVSLNDELGTPNDEPTKVVIEFVNGVLSHFSNVQCEGSYRHHLQGICTNDIDAIYWSFTTTFVKTDNSGSVIKNVEVASHHGDLCHHNGRIYVAVNLGEFNDPKGNADSWVYVYDADDLTLLSKHETQEVFHGAGGIEYRDGRFFAVGGLPDSVPENYVYEYDADFKFMKKHVIKSGHTHLGIQTAAFAHDRWWFGCYGDPKILLVTDSDFNLLGRYEFDCSLGIVGLSNGQLFSAGGRCEKDKGCTGNARLVVPDEVAGLRVLTRSKDCD